MREPTKPAALWRARVDRTDPRHEPNSNETAEIDWRRSDLVPRKTGPDAAGYRRDPDRGRSGSSGQRGNHRAGLPAFSIRRIGALGLKVVSTQIQQHNSTIDCTDGTGRGGGLASNPFVCRVKSREPRMDCCSVPIREIRGQWFSLSLRGVPACPDDEAIHLDRHVRLRRPRDDKAN